MNERYLLCGQVPKRKVSMRLYDQGRGEQEHITYWSLAKNIYILCTLLEKSFSTVLIYSIFWMNMNINTPRYFTFDKVYLRYINKRDNFFDISCTSEDNCIIFFVPILTLTFCTTALFDERSNVRCISSLNAPISKFSLFLILINLWKAVFFLWS